MSGAEGQKDESCCLLSVSLEKSSERCQRCSGSVQTKSLVFARSFLIMQGEIVHERCDGIIADHEFSAQFVRWCCVGVLSNWNF